MTHRTDLDRLEAEAASIIRDAVFSSTGRVALLFSGGKDSAVVRHIAMRALESCHYNHVKLVNIDTGHNFPEVEAFIERTAATTPFEHVPYYVQHDIDSGAVEVAEGQSRNSAQSVTLRRAIEQGAFTTLIGGARRDEEKARAKERVFSVRRQFGGWDPAHQRPELWGIYNTTFGEDTKQGDNFRVFPISNWTELDVWRYIERENIELPSIYYAHERNVILRGDRLIPYFPNLMPSRVGEMVVREKVRFRTVGDITCTCPVASDADTVAKIIQETMITTISERGATRADDAASEAAMEQRKKQGYF